MGKQTRILANENYKRLGKPIPYPNDEVVEVEEVEVKPKKKKKHGSV